MAVDGQVDYVFADLDVLFWPRAETETESPTHESGKRATGTAVEPDIQHESNEAATARDAVASDSTDAATPPVVAPTAPARLTVLVSPWGSVWINGKPRGSAPLKSTSLKPGRYKVGAGQGTPSQTRTVRLREGQRTTIRFDLTE